MALITTMSLLVVLSALAAALLLSASTEARIAASFQASLGGRHAADAAAERALLDLATTIDWNGVLDGSVRSSFTDGPPSGSRSLGSNTQVDLGQVRNLTNCGHAHACSDAELDAVTADRPWGPNNPRWQLFAYGPLARVSGRSGATSPFYVVVLVADDPGETDGDPTHDAAGTADPGHGVVWLRAEALGPTGYRRAVELTVAQAVDTGGTPAVRVVSWKRVG